MHKSAREIIQNKSGTDKLYHIIKVTWAELSKKRKKKKKCLISFRHSYSFQDSWLLFRKKLQGLKVDYT